MHQRPEHAPNDCLFDDPQKHFTHHAMSDQDHRFQSMYNLSLLELSLPTARRISRIGYILSVSTLIVSFCILVGIRSLRCQRNKLHLHLFVSFMIRGLMFLTEDSGLLDSAIAADISFVSGDHLIEVTEETSKSSPACKIFVCIWLYAVMANYSWILIEGLYLHNLIFLALMAPALSITRYIVLGWGFPMPFLMSWIVLSSTSGSMLCWTESLNPNYFWIIRGPITASIITNFILFLNITRVVYLKTFAPQSPRHSRYRNLFRSTLILLPLFGVHYTVTTVISTVLEKNKKEELTWLQLDQVFCSFQGSVVALLCCFLNSEVQSTLWNMWLKWKTTYGHLFIKRKRKCRKHSRAGLTSQDAESNTMSSWSGHCSLCAQESRDIVIRQSQETVVSFLDLEVKEEEGAVNHFCNHESTCGVNDVQSTSCKVSEESFLPQASVSSTAAPEDITSASTQLPSTPLLQQPEPPLFNVTQLDEASIKDSVIEITPKSSSNLECPVCEGIQPSASANDVLFLLHSGNSDGSSQNFPCCYGIIAEESSLKSERITKNVNEIRPESMHKVLKATVTPPTACCLSTIPQDEGCYFQECIDNSNSIKTSGNINTFMPHAKVLCDCQSTRMKTSKIRSSSNFTNIPEFHYVVTDLTAHKSREMEFKDGAVAAGGCETHNSTAELSERIKTSMTFLKPQVNEDESNLNIFDDANESRLPLCSTQKYRERSRSEGARWFCSVKKSKVSKGPPEWIELNRSDPVILLRSSGLPSVQLVKSPHEFCGSLKRSYAQRKERKPANPENLQVEESKTHPEKYHQVKTRAITDQNFRPRSSSYCCRPTQRRQGNREASPRIPPEWMTKNNILTAGNDMHLHVGSDQSCNGHSISPDSSHNSQMTSIQGTPGVPIISSHDDQNVQNENIIVREFTFGTFERAEYSVPKSA